MTRQEQVPLAIMTHLGRSCVPQTLTQIANAVRKSLRTPEIHNDEIETALEVLCMNKITIRRYDITDQWRQEDD